MASSKRKPARSTEAIKRDFDAAHAAGMRGLKRRDYAALAAAIDREGELIEESKANAASFSAPKKRKAPQKG